MSSSDDDLEFFDASPVVSPEEPVARRGNRRKAHTPSPNKVPRKKQREVLRSANGEVAKVDDDDDNEEGNRRNPRRIHQHQIKRKRTEASPTESILEDDYDRRSSASSEMENRPPPPSAAAVLADEIPEESSQPVTNGEAQVRSRKRLSIRSDPSEVDGRRSSISSGSNNGLENEVTTPSEALNIYATCSQMFNSNKINPQNAFNLRLLDCINQMINSPGYDKSNMQLTSSTVEIGTKIYVCRVDNTHSQVLSLASEITLQQRRKKKDGPEGEEANNAGLGEGGEEGWEDEEGTGRRQRQKKTIRKRGKLIEEDNSKLLTNLEEQNVKFVTRRNCLKKKFNDMIYNDLEFDYMSYFLEPEDEHPLQAECEKEKLKSQLTFQEYLVDANNICRLDFMQFSHLPEFDPETYDVWGRPLNEAEEMRDVFSHDPQLPISDEFAYDPAKRPTEYPDEGVPDNLMNDTLGEALPHFGDGDENDDKDALPLASFHDIRSLDHLEDYFNKVRNILKVSKSKYGWCGPNFVRPKSTWPVQKQGRKARVRKEPERIDFTKIDWNDKGNKFNCSHAGRTVLDDKVIEGWSTKKTTIPFLGIEITSYDDDFDPLDFQNENDPKFVPTIFKLFTSRNRSILDLLKTSERRRISSSGCGDHGDDGFDVDNDIELPRDIVEDFCSQPQTEDGYHPPDGAMQGDGEAGWPFPASIPGLLKEDPLSLVSGIDSIRFSRKPKPIDMSQLKRAILKTLMNTLRLDTENAQPLVEDETRIDLAQLMLEVLKKLDSRTEKLLSVPIFIVALMHVVADKRLFVDYESDPDCPVVVCRGKNFNHADHIPMPVGGLDYD